MLEDATAQVDEVWAVIPARGGSRGVPGKNLRLVAGVPLVERAIHAALRVPEITKVIVSTDNAEIGARAAHSGAVVSWRPAELATDTATSESALRHVLHSVSDDPPKVIAMLQCTSPVIPTRPLGGAVRRVLADDADVVFSAAPDHGFYWRLNSAGLAVAVGHDAGHRPRRQDREPQFRETGAFYVMRTTGFIAAGIRFFGRVKLEPVPSWTALEIDGLSDLELANRLVNGPGSAGADGE